MMRLKNILYIGPRTPQTNRIVFAECFSYVEHCETSLPDNFQNCNQIEEWGRYFVNSLPWKKIIFLLLQISRTKTQVLIEFPSAPPNTLFWTRLAD